MLMYIKRIGTQQGEGERRKIGQILIVPQV